MSADQINPNVRCDESKRIASGNFQLIKDALKGLIVRATLTEELVAGGSAEATNADTGGTVEVSDWLLGEGQSIASGIKVFAVQIGATLWVFSAECP